MAAREDRRDWRGHCRTARLRQLWALYAGDVHLVEQLRRQYVDNRLVTNVLKEDDADPRLVGVVWIMSEVTACLLL